MNDGAMSGDWEHIVALSHEMQSLAEREEWELLLEKEGERRAAIVAFFAQPVSVEDASAVGAAIKELMAMDREMMTQFGDAREEVARKMGALKTGRRMDAAYSGGG
jgi:hypothetical protein